MRVAVRAVPGRRGRDPAARRTGGDHARPAAAIEHGVGMIHQHFMLVPTLTVAENVALGLKSSRGPLTDLDRVSERIGSYRAPTGCGSIRPRTCGSSRSGERQRVEIMKALYPEREAPRPRRADGRPDTATRSTTSSSSSGRWSPTAGGWCSSRTRSARSSRCRTAITVLRDGRVVGTVVPADVTRRDLARDDGRARCRGRGPAATTGRKPARSGCRCAGSTVRGDRGQEAVRDVSLDVHAAEVVGIAGVSGQRAARARGGAGRPPAGHAGVGPAGGASMSPAAAPPRSGTRASATFPRSACATASSATSRSPTT